MRDKIKIVEIDGTRYQFGRFRADVGTFILMRLIGSVVKAGHASDAQTQSLVGGKANIVDVVTAVADTEAAIETLVSVRDKVVQAYQAILQMPI